MSDRLIILGYTCCKRRLDKTCKNLTDHLGNQNVLADKTIKGVNKMKIVLTLKTYVVPNVDNPIVRIPIWQETQTCQILMFPNIKRYRDIVTDDNLAFTQQVLHQGCQTKEAN